MPWFRVRLPGRYFFPARLLARRTDQLALLALTLLALLLRLYQLDAQSLWYDEGVTVTLAQRTLLALTQWTARDIQPPLYYYVIWGWGRLAGWSEWSLRFPSACFGALAVPLLAILARRLTGCRLPSLLAGLLVALHPLLIYYAQEARMYTLLVALSLVAAYWLLCLREPAQSGWRNWLGYGLVATLAVYTHYFAFFLLLALGVAFLLDQFLARNSALRRSQLLRFVVTHLLIALLYLAWIGPLWQQFTTDTSYWQGRLKLWEALRTVALRFTSGETTLEATGKPLLLVFAIMTLGLIGVMAWRARTDQRVGRTLLYSLCWLAIPLLGVLGLAAFVPKFNVRYVLLALPGLLLLWSSGISLLLTQYRSPLIGRVIGLICTLLLIVSFGSATRNWFVDPAFTKAQWREVASYVRAHAQPDEAVVLVSGHAWPIWDYYAPDLPAIHLPALEILDVNAVLDFANTGDPLRTALAAKRGVWLVDWQAEVVDPNGVTGRQLLRAAAEQPLQADFWQVGLRHFVDLKAAAILSTPPIDNVLEANFGNQLRLLGYTVAPDGDLLLFWQLGSDPATPLPDLHINLRTVTPDQLLYTDPADRRPADYGFPVMRWQPGQLVMGRIAATEWAGAGALPAAYQVQLGVYDPAGDAAGLDLLDPAGNPTGKFALLDVTLPRATPADDLASPANSVEVQPGLQVALAVEPAAAEPGQSVALTFHWLIDQPLTAPPGLLLQWRADGARTVAASDPLPLPANLPLTSWPVGQWVRQVVALVPPLHLPAGEYALTVTTADQTSAAQHPFTILPSSRNFTLPPLAVKSVQDFFQPDGEVAAQVRLLGLRHALLSTVAANQALTLDLAWQSIAPLVPAADYVVTVQLLGTDGRPVAQIDQPLPGGSAGWLPGQVAEQTLTLPMPPAAGDYRLILALYHTTPDGFPRLVSATGADFIALGTLTVTP